MKLHVGYCVREKTPCVRWVDKYFEDCLCNLNDYFSFSFGIVSLICWGIAEIPQIVTNFKSKSSHGISLIFLLTWIAGDIFNLVGCLLEPATLPTQYYTAVLYTASTIILVLQSIYYDYFYSWWKSRKMENRPKIQDHDKNPPKLQKSVDSGIPIPLYKQTTSAVTNSYYYASARSMASGSTPPTWSYLRAARSGPSVMGLDRDYSSSDDENNNNHRRRRRPSFESSPPPPPPQKSRTKPQPIPRSAGNATILASSLGLLPGSNAFVQAYGRKLLHEHGTMMMMNGGGAGAAAGQWLGWMMAAIYMGGRIPQIWLNIRRGSVEGLNPLMFVFALIANSAYVASIVVRTIEWDKIKANLPWLLDAAVCVVLDLFIILQFVYYKNFKRRRALEEERLVDNNKPLLS
ncbi:uncharacterized protein LOC124915108 [Impatiens glandulifera]|uniref:uncharacterized protein LOC124915108 n=1 Tax=Impatiens glandulifera TaxID=253017 RepID=UPI001FB0C230|nr:uncharacterized protein LOC124915108 [Impatiens glandulifera]